MYYSNANNSMGNHPEWAYERRTDENGEYITIDGQTVYTVDSNNSTGMSADSNNGYLTFFYKDSDGTLQSYAVDAFYDNMKIMLDECAQMNVNVIIRDIACISNVKYAQGRDNKRYYAYVTQSIINEKVRKLASEYDNVISVDLFNATKNHFTDIYNSFSNSVDQLPDYYYNADGSLKECYTTVTDWRYQQLLDTYW